MSLNAVQQYLLSVLDGMPSANLPPALAYVMPPVTTDLIAQPVIFIWGAKLNEERLTLARTTGEKRVRYRCSLWLQFVSTNDLSTSQDFPVFLDAVRKLLRTLPLGNTITDPVTGETSQIIDIGETMQQDYATPTAMADQRLLSNNATMTVGITEHLAGA